MSSDDIQILDGISRKLAEELVSYARQQVKRSEKVEDVWGTPVVQMDNPKAIPQNIRYRVSWAGEKGTISVECILASFNGYCYDFLNMGVFTR